MAAVDNFFFYEDEVFRVTRKGTVQFGTVIENSELVSSNDETSEEEFDGDYKMKKGHIRVAWHPSGYTEVISEAKVGLADRSLMPGDVVKRLVKDKNTQRGYCSNIKVSATVQIVGTKLVIENLATSQLLPLGEFSKDLAVYLDHWVGVIRDVHTKLLVSCSDGSKAYICDPTVLKSLMNQRRTKCLHEDFPRKSDFYPGQKLLAPRYILSSVTWIVKTGEYEKLASKHKHLKLCVERMDVDYVDVAWRCTAFTGNSTQSGLNARDSIVKGDDLKRLRVLNHFESCTMQVGDRVMYTPTSRDAILPLDVWREKKREHILATSQSLPVPHRRKRSKKISKKLPSESDNTRETEAQGDLDSTLKDPEALAQHASDTTLVPDLGGIAMENEGAKPVHDVPAINLEFASEGDSSDWESDNSEYFSTTSMCTTETSSVASSTRHNSESSNQDQGYWAASWTTRPKRSPSALGIATKVTRRKFKPKQRAKSKKSDALVIRGGDELTNVLGRQCVVEILCTQSSADVVWQDGTMEQNISSMDLYPIHYLDDKEFFPGDFVVKSLNEDKAIFVFGEYGVVRQMHHVARTARIQWFEMNTQTDDSNSPQYRGEEEMSVYDIKDHPDFQFRPGSVVMNMSFPAGTSFTIASPIYPPKKLDLTKRQQSNILSDSNTENKCEKEEHNNQPLENQPLTDDNDRVYVGQVLDNFPEGRIKVCWVDGSITSVWPQDLYKIGDYNSDEGELWATSSEDSWETDISLLDDEEDDVDALFSDVTGDETNLDISAVHKSSKASSTPDGNEKFELKLFRTVLKLSHVLDLLQKELSAPFLHQSYAQLHVIFKNLTYLDKLLNTTLFSDPEIESLLQVMQSFEMDESLFKNFPDAIVSPTSVQKLLVDMKMFMLCRETSGLVELMEKLDKDDCKRDTVICKTDEVNCKTDENSKTDTVNSETNEVNSNTDTVICKTDEVNCKTDDLCCETDLVSCKTDDVHCTIDVVNCKTDVSNCKSDVANCKTDEANCTTEPLTCKSTNSRCESKEVNCKKTDLVQDNNPSVTDQVNCKLSDSELEASCDTSAHNETSDSLKSKYAQLKTQYLCAVSQCCDTLRSRLLLAHDHFITIYFPQNDKLCLLAAADSQPDNNNLPLCRNEKFLANIKYIKQKLSGAGGGKLVLNDDVWELAWDPKTEGDGKKKEVEKEDDSSPVFFNLGGKSRSTDRKSLLVSSRDGKADNSSMGETDQDKDEDVFSFFGVTIQNGAIVKVDKTKTESSHKEQSREAESSSDVKTETTKTESAKREGDLKSKEVMKDTSEPSMKDTNEPSMKDTNEPSMKDTTEPSMKYTTEPSMKDTNEPSMKDTNEPSMKDTTEPSMKDTTDPSMKETKANIGKEDVQIVSCDQEKDCEEVKPAVSTLRSSITSDNFLMLESLGSYPHRYLKRAFTPGPQMKAFFRALRREVNLLLSALPPGIWVRGFEDRLDLLSVMIEGPRRTPYEDGLFYFDFHLPADYPHSPPLCHYISYCSDRLNPNLYETGKVCVSLLGTWSGRGTEVWTTQSTLLQILISIQGLILNAEPYYNEAGYERQRASQHGQENARMYNEMVLLKLVTAMQACVHSPPSVWARETREHFKQRAKTFANRLEYWLKVSAQMSETENHGGKERMGGDSKTEVKIEGSKAENISKDEDKTGCGMETKDVQEKSFETSVSTICDPKHPELLVSSESSSCVERASNSSIEGTSNSDSGQARENSAGEKASDAQSISVASNSVVGESQIAYNSVVGESQVASNSVVGESQVASNSVVGESQRSQSLNESDEFELPQFPLLPASRGFCLTLQKLITSYRTAMDHLQFGDDIASGKQADVVESEPDSDALGCGKFKCEESSEQIVKNCEDTNEQTSGDLRSRGEPVTTGAVVANNRDNQTLSSLEPPLTSSVTSTSKSRLKPKLSGAKSTDMTATADEAKLSEKKSSGADQTRIVPRLNTNEKLPRPSVIEVASDIVGSLEPNYGKRKSLDTVNNNKLQ